jgi:hypothetical protein
MLWVRSHHRGKLVVEGAEQWLEFIEWQRCVESERHGLGKQLLLDAIRGQVAQPRLHVRR